MSISITNYRKSTEPRINSRIVADTWGGRKATGSNLIASNWNKAQFRAPMRIGNIAVNIKVTGRTVQFDTQMNAWVRIQIEFVGDCKESTFERGWMKV